MSHSRAIISVDELGMHKSRDRILHATIKKECTSSQWTEHIKRIEHNSPNIKT